MLKFKFYLTSKYLRIFLYVFFSITLLTFLIDYVELIRRLGDSEIKFLELINLTLLKQPALILDILPFIILISAIIFILKINESSELAVIRTSGVSLFQAFLMPISLILIIGLIEVALINNLATKATQKFEQNIEEFLKNDYKTEEEILKSKIWYKQSELEDPYIFQAEETILNKKNIEFKKLKTVFLDSGNVIYSDSAVIHNDKLFLYNNKVFNRLSQNARISNELSIPANLSKEYIYNKAYLTAQANKTLSIKELLKTIKIFKEMDLEYKKFEADLHGFFVKPITYINLFLVASIFCIALPRSHKKHINILFSVIVSFVIYFILNLLFSLASSGKISILLGIWVSSIWVFLLLFFLLLKKERSL